MNIGNIDAIVARCLLCELCDKMFGLELGDIDLLYSAIYLTITSTVISTDIFNNGHEITLTFCDLLL